MTWILNSANALRQHWNGSANEPLAHTTPPPTSKRTKSSSSQSTSYQLVDSAVEARPELPLSQLQLMHRTSKWKLAS